MTLTLEQIQEGRRLAADGSSENATVYQEHLAHTWLAKHAEALLDAAERVARGVREGFFDATHYAPKATPGMRADTRRALCGVVYQTGVRNGAAGSSNLEHVTCAYCKAASK
jgi:hypothetical protein